MKVEDIKVFKDTLNSGVPDGPIQEKWDSHVLI
jgi:hypothetical protein